MSVNFGHNYFLKVKNKKQTASEKQAGAIFYLKGIFKTPSIGMGKNG
jgi:hypothetical protein